MEPSGHTSLPQEPETPTAKTNKRALTLIAIGAFVVVPLIILLGIGITITGVLLMFGRSISAAQFAEQARVDFENGDSEAAIEGYTRAIELEPENADHYYMRGNILILMPEPDYDAAMADLDESLRLNPDYLPALLLRGWLNTNIGEVDAAISDLERFITLAPEPTAMAHISLGVAYDAVNRNEEAMAAFNQAIALNPDVAEAYSGRARLHWELGNEAEALADVEHALEINPDQIDAVWLRGTLRYALHDDAEGALEDFTHTIELNPDFARAYFARAHIYDTQGKITLALNDYRKFLELWDQDDEMRELAEESIEALGGTVP